MWTGFQAERVASLHARFGTLNAWRALGSWKRLNCCLRNSWDTPTILDSTRSKLVQAGNISATSHRHSRIWRLISTATYLDRVLSGKDDSVWR